MGTLPTFVIVGAMRSGTTALVRYLGAHPDVFVVAHKEVHFFDRHFDEGIDWYMSCFEGANGARAIGEGTPRYMYDEAAARRMASVIPNAKLIATLRNPVDRAYSHYWHNRAKSQESLPFDAAIAAEPTRPPGDGSAYLARGRYLAQLERLCEYYTREQLHVVLFDDLRDHPRETFAELCRFIGVREDMPDVVGRPLNRYADVRFPRLRDAARHGPRGLRNLVGRLNYVGYPPMAPTVRADLIEGFADDNAALAKWLGRDLSSWSR